MNQIDKFKLDFINFPDFSLIYSNEIIKYYQCETVNFSSEPSLMEKTLQIIDQMREEGLFEKYAIGGGIATLFYTEPIATFDLDVFLLFREDTGLLLSLSTIYEWLKNKGYNPIKEHVIIEGIPVQLLPVYNKLVREAVENALKRKYGDTATFVLRPEYLIAIMLQTNRAKGRDRILKLFDETDISMELLETILIKHDLNTVYQDFRKKFYET